MTLVKVNQPFKSIDGMMKEFFNEFPSTVSKTLREDVLHYPPANILEEASSYLLELSAPGLEKSDFKVSLENNILTISTENKTETILADIKSIRKEFSIKGFKRSFTIDEKIESENITAKYENGILKLTLPKKESAKPVSKSISIA